MMIYRMVPVIMLFISFTCIAQNIEKYESKLVRTERLTIEYMDLGGEGSSLVVVQGAHNYFDQSSSNPYIKHSNNSWIEFYSRFSDNYHVMAPLKRGFGRTDPQVEVESVQTATEDILSWLDAVGIKKAFFIGRDVSAQYMLHLVENYPDRVHGLIFIDPTFVFSDKNDDATQEFIFFSYTDSYSASEFRDYKLKKSELYRPAIFADNNKQIKVPALLFYHEIYSQGTLEMGRIERFIKWVENSENIEWEKEYSSLEIAEYFKNLSKNKDKMYHIRDYLRAENPTLQMNESLIRAFNNYLVIFNETHLDVDDVSEALLNVYFPVSKAFLYMSSKK